jgi:hypothetical protein
VLGVLVVEVVIAVEVVVVAAPPVVVAAPPVVVVAMVIPLVVVLPTVLMMILAMVITRAGGVFACIGGARGAGKAGRDKRRGSSDAASNLHGCSCIVAIGDGANARIRALDVGATRLPPFG